MVKRPLFTIQTGTAKVIHSHPRGLGFTSDGQHLIIENVTFTNNGERVGMISVLDPDTLDVVTTYSILDDLPYGFAVNPQGSTIATYGWQGAVVRDVMTGEVLASTPRMCFECACFSTDGSKLVLSRAGDAFFTFDIKSQVLVEGMENPMATTSLYPVSDDIFLVSVVAQEGASFGFSIMNEQGIMTEAFHRIKGKSFESSSLIASFDAYNNRVCAVDSMINVFGYPQTNWLASFDEWGEFVYPDPNAAFYLGGIDWSNPVFLGSSGILACSSSYGLLFLDTNTNELLANLDVDVERGGQMLAYHEGRQLLASVDGDGLCIVRQISITE